VEDEFQRRVIPLLLDNSRINDWEYRIIYVDAKQSHNPRAYRPYGQLLDRPVTRGFIR
jgi:hypothetical protein